MSIHAITTDELEAAVNDLYDDYCFTHQDMTPSRGRHEYRQAILQKLEMPVQITEAEWTPQRAE